MVSQNCTHVTLLFHSIESAEETLLPASSANYQQPAGVHRARMEVENDDIMLAGVAQPEQQPAERPQSAPPPS